MRQASYRQTRNQQSWDQAHSCANLTGKRSVAMGLSSPAGIGVITTRVGRSLGRDEDTLSFKQF